MEIIVLVVIVITAVLFYVTINNSLVTVKQQVARAWANIDVILKQRFDEIPQLIEVINQYVQHEKNILLTIAEARKQYGMARNEDEKMKANQTLSAALPAIFALGENYPELKSNNNFVQLQTRISELEESLAHRREFYNEAVTTYNTRIEQFPSSLIAGRLGYTEKNLFQVAEAEKQRPNLKINV
jgi:LemA protein